jgi:hypothetical protein
LLCTYALVDTNDQMPETLILLHSHSIERESSATQNV